MSCISRLAARSEEATENDNFGDVRSPHHIDHGGLRKFDEDEKFNDNECEEDLERVDVE